MVAEQPPERSQDQRSSRLGETREYIHDRVIGECRSLSYTTLENSIISNFRRSFDLEILVGLNGRTVSIGNEPVTNDRLARLAVDTIIVKQSTESD